MRVLGRRHQFRFGRFGLVIAGLIFVGALVAISVSLYNQKQTYAIDGSSGTGGACGGYCTDNGYGWFKYSLYGTNGPGGGFANGTQWSSIRSACGVYGADYAWVHVVFNGSSQRRSFDFEPESYDSNGIQQTYMYEGHTYYNLHYSGDASESSVHSYFNQSQSNNASGVGGTYGVNIGWFCSYDNPPWAVSVTSTANKTAAEPGEKIIWTHNITNDGPNKTKNAVTWRSQDRGWSTAAGTVNWTFAAGSTMNTTATNTSEYTVAAADFGKKVCRSTYASPANYLGGTIESAPACVTIGKKPKVQIHGGDLIVGRSFVDGASAASSNGTETSQTVKLR